MAASAKREQDAACCIDGHAYASQPSSRLTSRRTRYESAFSSQKNLDFSLRDGGAASAFRDAQGGRRSITSHQLCLSTKRNAQERRGWIHMQLQRMFSELRRQLRAWAWNRSKNGGLVWEDRERHMHWDALGVLPCAVLQRMQNTRSVVWTRTRPRRRRSRRGPGGSHGEGVAEVADLCSNPVTWP